MDMTFDEYKTYFKDVLTKIKYEKYSISPVNACGDIHPVYLLSKDGWYGIGFEIDNDKIMDDDFFYGFQNTRIIAAKEIIGDTTKCLLELITKNKKVSDEFILICMDFVGFENEEKRKLINDNPMDWINNWKDLLGNKASNDVDYSFLGELITLKYLLLKGKNPLLTKKGTFDIEEKDENYEVKTTILRYNSIVEIHSKYQMDGKELEEQESKKLNLVFIRLEESMGGISINSLIQDLEKLKYQDIEDLKQNLSTINSNSKNRKYKILEMRKYLVDEKFPKITKEDLKNINSSGKIVNVKYDVQLDGIENEEINYSEVK